jgi:hypothetical protein
LVVTPIHPPLGDIKVLSRSHHEDRTWQAAWSVLCGRQHPQPGRGSQSQVKARSTSSALPIQRRPTVVESLLETVVLIRCLYPSFNNHASYIFALYSNVGIKSCSTSLHKRRPNDRETTSRCSSMSRPIRSMQAVLQYVQGLTSVIAQTQPQVQLPSPPGLVLPPRLTLSTPMSLFPTCISIFGSDLELSNLE